MATIVARKTRHSIRAERAFYLSMTGAILLLVVWGFAPSFLFRRWMTPPPTFIDRPDWMSWAFLLHGTLFMLWLAAFAGQAVLIGSKRLRLHKAIGRSLYPLYFAIVAAGLFVTYVSVRHGTHGSSHDSVTFGALPLLIILVFGVLVWLGLNERREPQRHKRLMLLGTIALSDAGVDRVALFHGFLPSWMTATVLLLVPLVLWDIATLRRVHPTTLWGGALVAAALLLWVPLGSTATWHGLVHSTTGIESVPPGQFAE
jgi:hypothetical protein